MLKKKKKQLVPSAACSLMLPEALRVGPPTWTNDIQKTATSQTPSMARGRSKRPAAKAPRSSLTKDV